MQSAPDWTALVLFGLLYVGLLIAVVVGLRHDFAALVAAFDKQNTLNAESFKRNEEAIRHDYAAILAVFDKQNAVNAEALRRHDEYHSAHFRHAGDTAIHKEGMSASEIKGLIEAMRDAFKVQNEIFERHCQDDENRDKRLHETFKEFRQETRDNFTAIGDRLPNKA